MMRPCRYGASPAEPEGGGSQEVTRGELPNRGMVAEVTWEIRATNTGEESIEGKALGGCHWHFRFYEVDEATGEPLFENFGGGACLDMYRQVSLAPGETLTDTVRGFVSDILGVPSSRTAIRRRRPSLSSVTRPGSLSRSSARSAGSHWSSRT